MNTTYGQGPILHNILVLSAELVTGKCLNKYFLLVWILAILQTVNLILFSHSVMFNSLQPHGCNTPGFPVLKFFSWIAHEWRRKWQPTPEFLPGESCGRRSLGAAVHRVAQSRTRLKWLSMHACIGEGNGDPLQNSCLQNPGDRGAWWAAVYGISQSRTRLKWLSRSSSMQWEN